MVKDGWNHQSPVAISEQTLTSSSHPKHGAMVLAEETDLTRQTNNLVQIKDAARLNNIGNSNNGGNAWGYFVSRENFIEMHIC